MPSAVKEFQLTTLVRDRQSGGRLSEKLCLFLGAGADIGSGGLTFKELKRQWYELALSRPIFRATSDEEINQWFQIEFRKLKAEDRGALIRRMFNEAGATDPSDAYKILALLIRAGGIDAVITTNFDTMLESAAEKTGGREFSVFAPGTAKPFRTRTGHISRAHCPYVKLHGDLAGDTVTVLTQDEIDKGDYSRELIELADQILTTHTLVIAGYSGWDVALATIIGRALSKSMLKVFWCKPTPPNPRSPLWQALPKDRIITIEADFSKTVELLARPYLEHPFGIHSPGPSFVRSLLEWRFQHANYLFSCEYTICRRNDLSKLFVRRDRVETALGRFFEGGNKNLAVVVGPSGTGKSTLGIRLNRRFENVGRRLLLLRGKTLNAAPDLEQMLLPYAGAANPEVISLLAFAHWLNAEGLQVIVFIDGLNELSPSTDECVKFLKNIVRSCFVLNGTFSLRFIVTVRHEVWMTMLPYLDEQILARTMWSPENKEGEILPLALDRFDHRELEGALANLNRENLVGFEYSALPSESREHLRDPFLLRIVAEVGCESPKNVTSNHMLRLLCERKIEKAMLSLPVTMAMDVLGNVAALCFSRRHDWFRIADLPPSMQSEINLRGLLDSGLVVQDHQGGIRFAHERIFQFFLALSFGRSPNSPVLETLDDVRTFLREVRSDAKALAAARIHILERLDQSFYMIELAQGALEPGDQGNRDDKDIFVFSKELILDAVRESSALAIEYCRQVAHNAGLADFSPLKVRTALQAAATMEPKTSLPILFAAVESPDQVCAAEAQIYIIDRLSQELLTRKETVDLLSDKMFAPYLSAAHIPAWKSIGRLILLVTALGPDNTHPSEYGRITASVERALMNIWQGLRIRDDDIETIFHQVTGNLDRYLFNSTKKHVRHFFGNRNRTLLLRILKKLRDGSCIDDADLDALQIFMRSSEYPLEFFLNNILFSLSSINDFEETISVWKNKIDQFDNNSLAEEVDFYVNVISYIYIIAGEMKDDSILEAPVRRILREMPDVVLHRPGQYRGIRRGFRDSFDAVFEDGFNPISGYLGIRPMIRRRAMTLDTYERLDVIGTESLHTLAPAFADAFDEFLSSGRIDEALIILHAIGQTISVWPDEGLATLRAIVGIREPRIRRALTRLLAEAYARHSTKTSRFLDLVRGSFNDDEMRTIQASADSRLGYRQFETYEWARIFHFLIHHLPKGRDKTIECLHALYSSDDEYDAMTAAASVLGVYGYSLK